MTTYDIAIVGAGIAGASLAARMAPYASVLLLEAEDQPGYHATGRSAAFWEETYGGPDVQPLTAASRAPLAAGDYLSPLGGLHIGRAADEAAVDAFMATFAGCGVPLARVDPRPLVPGLRDDWIYGVFEPTCAYIDVARLHADCLATARRAGAVLVTGAELRSAVRRDARWALTTAAGAFAATVIVNAAGAWADRVAAMAGVAPLGITPYRRTMVQLQADPAPAAASPHVAHIGGDFYFKPEANGRLWLSPHDEIACDPGDAQPEELDVAIALDRLEQAVDWRIVRVERTWAGLRSFAPDRLPVYGFDPTAPGFFWCAGQGGFGIQTAPAAAALAAELLGAPADPITTALDPERYAPGRFRS